MKAVLDTSAFIYLNNFRMFEKVYTVTDVLDEVKDRISSLKLSGIEMKVLEPAEKSVNEIKLAAKETGDISKLSKTDIKVLALAKEKGLVLVSDDYNVQNVAEKIGIDYISLFNKRITKLVKWGNYCINCEKFYGKKICPKCGNVLTKRRVSEEFINKQN
ncbi:MAG: ribonuclease VapC [Candidatus Aenigmarchaeota archaeon]|nr:ribonuclease VapC [Candidatus Aenigmarchaeota archaeon]